MLLLGNCMELGAVLHLFRHIFDMDFGEHLVRIMEILSRIREPQTALEFLELVLRYVYHARNDDEDTVRKYIVQGIEYFDNEKAKEAAMTLAERIERRGEKRGKKIGEKRGEKIGISSVYNRLLRKRFGGMTPVLEKRLTDADLDMLNRFGDSIPDFRNLKEAEKWWDEQGTEH